MTNAAFGSLIGWGVGARGAAARVGTITLAELQAAGITLPMALHWQAVYQRAIMNNAGAAAAHERLQLMQRAIELLNARAVIIVIRQAAEGTAYHRQILR